MVKEYPRSVQMKHFSATKRVLSDSSLVIPESIIATLTRRSGVFRAGGRTTATVKTETRIMVRTRIVVPLLGLGSIVSPKCSHCPALSVLYSMRTLHGY